MATPWDARTYDTTSEPQQEWAAEVVARLAGIAADARVLDVGCGTGRVTESLLELVPDGRVLAIDASEDMVGLARERLGERATVWCADVLELELEEPVDAIVSTATLHWVGDHERLWGRLAAALAPGGVLEAQCGGDGNIDRVREVIDRVARESFPELVGFSPWVFAGPPETERRLSAAGFTGAVGSSSVPPVRGISTGSSARRSSRRIFSVCQRIVASRSPWRCWPVCARRSTMCA